MPKWRHTEAAKRKISESKRGRACSPETKAKISATMKRRWRIEFKPIDADIEVAATTAA